MAETRFMRLVKLDPGQETLDTAIDKLNAWAEIISAHTHAFNQGPKVTIDGLNIQESLQYNDNGILRNKFLNFSEVIETAQDEASVPNNSIYEKGDVILFKNSQGVSAPFGGSSTGEASALGDLWITTPVLPTTEFAQDEAIAINPIVKTSTAPAPIGLLSNIYIGNVPKIPPTAKIIGFWFIAKVGSVEVSRIFMPWGQESFGEKDLIFSEAGARIAINYWFGGTSNGSSGFWLSGVVQDSGGNNIASPLPANSTVEIHTAIVSGGGSIGTEVDPTVSPWAKLNNTDLIPKGKISSYSSNIPRHRP